MNPIEKGWLKRYLEINKSKLLKGNQIDANAYSSEEEMIYALLQPTGLLYGHPIKFPYLKYDDVKEWENKDKTKVLLADSLIGHGKQFFAKEMTNENDADEVLHMLAQQVSEFYFEIFPQLATKSKKSLFGRKRKDLEITETIIAKRVELKRNLDKNFWTSFFQNSLLFLDVYYFNQWVNPNHIITKEEIHELHDDIRLRVLEIISAAAHANQIVEVEERNLYNYFLHSSQLPDAKEKEAAKYIDEGMKLSDIDLSQWKDSWLIKKYLLELAILTVWSDQEMQEEEYGFIDKLREKLGFSEEESEKSKIAVESFVLQNYEQVHYLQEKQNYKIVADRFNRSMKKVLKFYKNSIVQEMRESKELVSLLNKSAKEQLSPEEKEKIRQQMLDILKTLPIFALIALPGRTLTLPILFKVLPKNVLPTAFQK
ncbi:MAG: hypothetical protein ISR55_06500 [Bacteroidetes bacterium]|nr:hypothetical protein [Bacteroidota bacterium]MBL6963454.1 hypothetical protein [Bacteroidota bacterium]